MIDQVHQPDNGYNCLDDAEETSGEKASVCAGNADGLEDGGGIVVLRDLLAFSCENWKNATYDSVDAGAVLPEEQHAAKEQTVLDLALLDCLEGSPETGTNDRTVVFNLSIDSSDLFDHVRVRSIEVTNPAQVLDSLIAVTARELPTRRLPQPDCTDEKQARRNKLNSEWDHPLASRRCHGLNKPIIDPEAHETTNLPSKLVNTDKSSTDRRRRKFRDVDRDHVTSSTDTQTGQNTATDDESEASIAIRAQHHTRT